MAVTLYDWIYSNYPLQRSIVNGRYGIVHITTILLCIALIIRIALNRHKSFQKRDRIICHLAATILLFEVSRRLINFTRTDVLSLDLTAVLHRLLPRPWCAISCWITIIAAIAKKKWLYNIASMCSLLCAIVFFVYPMVGFNHAVYLFEDVYSITTHALLLITSLSMISLGLTDFRYHRAGRWDAARELIVLGGIFAYAFLEIFILKIEADPLYFLPGNDVQNVFGLSYPMYLVVYIGFLALYFNAFYAVQQLLEKHKEKPLLCPA